MATVCKIFGSAKYLSNKCLPTYCDIVKCYYKLPNLSKSRHAVLVDMVIDLWKLTGIPTIPKRNVVRNLKKYFEKYQSFLKSFTAKGGKKHEEKLKDFRESGNKLFDIAICKCKTTETCHCPASGRNPLAIFDFLTDQRNKRIMKIQNLPKVELNAYQYNNSDDSDIDQFNDDEGDQESDDDDDNDDVYDDDDDEEYVPQRKRFNRSQNRANISAIVEQADRYGISKRGAAAIASATLNTFGIVNKTSQNLVIDKNKIQRQTLKNQQSTRHPKNIRYVFFI